MKSCGRILVRANNWIGDAVLSTPALHALRRAFPEAEISVLAKPWVIPVLRNNPDADRILLYDAGGRHKGVRGVNRLGSDLRGERLDCAILLQRAFEAAWIAFLARVPLRVGLRTEGRGCLLTHAIAVSREELLIPRAKHNLAMLQAVGIAPAAKGLVLRTNGPELEKARQRLAAIGVRPDERLYGLSPGAAFGPAKRWLPERFAAVAERLAALHHGRGLVFGGPGERELGERIAREAPGAANLAGTTTLDEAIALIGLCGLFITNDSGLMHIAAGLDVPLVAIFGPTDPRTTAPWSSRHRLVRKEGVCCSPCLKRECEQDHRCMRSISVEEVLAAAASVIEDYGWAALRERTRILEGALAQPIPVVTLGA
ncbi:MAG: lipopolysaccharide heptosyltransferase II [bacterium]